MNKNFLISLRLFPNKNDIHNSLKNIQREKREQNKNAEMK